MTIGNNANSKIQAHLIISKTFTFFTYGLNYDDVSIF